MLLDDSNSVDMVKLLLYSLICWLENVKGAHFMWKLYFLGPFV